MKFVKHDKNTGSQEFVTNIIFKVQRQSEEKDSRTVGLMQLCGKEDSKIQIFTGTQRNNPILHTLVYIPFFRFYLQSINLQINLFRLIYSLLHLFPSLVLILVSEKISFTYKLNKYRANKDADNYILLLSSVLHTSAFFCHDVR